MLTIKVVDLNKTRIYTISLQIFRQEICRKSFVRAFCEIGVLLDYPGMNSTNPAMLECRSLAENVSKIRRRDFEIKCVYVRTDREARLTRYKVILYSLRKTTPSKGTS